MKMQMRPYAIGFVFSNKCEVREGDIQKKKRGRGGEKQWQSKSPLRGSWWCQSWSFGVGGNPRNTEVYLCPQPGFEKVQAPSVGQGVLHEMTLILWIMGHFRNFRWFMTSSKMWQLPAASARLSQLWLISRDEYPQATCEYWKATICHGMEWISSTWSTPSSTALRDTEWNTHFYYELRVMCHQPFMLQCCSILKGTAAQRSQLNAVLETESLRKQP